MTPNESVQASVPGNGYDAAVDAARRRRLHAWFDIGALFKGAEGLLELVSGIWLAFDPSILHNVMFRLTAKELLRDPDDRIANTLRDFADTFTMSSHTFPIVYLAGHGVLKIILAEGLLRERRWAFPFAIVVLLLFSAYQLYRFSHTHAPILPVLSALDAGIAWLVWRESKVRRRLSASPSMHAGRPA